MRSRLSQLVALIGYFFIKKWKTCLFYLLFLYLLYITVIIGCPNPCPSGSSPQQGTDGRPVRCGFAGWIFGNNTKLILLCFIYFIIKINVFLVLLYLRWMCHRLLVSQWRWWKHNRLLSWSRLAIGIVKRNRYLSIICILLLCTLSIILTKPNTKHYKYIHNDKYCTRFAYSF